MCIDRSYKIKYTLEQQIDRYIQLYQNLLAERSDRSLLPTP
jgi:hypothetical protein